MQNRNTKFEFIALLSFLIAATLLLTNGFVARIFAQDNTVDVYKDVEPIGQVLNYVLEEYVRDVELDQVVEGALIGMLSSLDRHSSYIPQEVLDKMREDTKGEFNGIGVQIKLDDDDNIMIFMPIVGSPAAEAGLQPFDIIVKIDDVPVDDLRKEGMGPNTLLSEAADRIRGPRGTKVKLTISRPNKDGGEPEILDIHVKRARVPLESIKEARLLDGGIGYARVEDFKENTAPDLSKRLKEFMGQGMQGFVLDLRWNPGGLLNASQQVCELFLPKNSLVTYTKGRTQGNGKAGRDDMQLYTKRRPVVPLGLPLMVLVNEQTASSSEIVTGALQFHKRALVVGEKTFGKGSVQTIIPVPPEKVTAVRLTTALYYTPADVTIDHQGILPDVEVPMEDTEERLLGLQLYRSFEDDPSKINEQNHGSVTNNEVITREIIETEDEQQVMDEVGRVYGEDAQKILNTFMERKRATEETMEDLQLKRAVEILREDRVWDNLINKYHRSVSETQMAADAETINGLAAAERRLLAPQGTAEDAPTPEEEDAPAE